MKANKLLSMAMLGSALSVSAATSAPDVPPNRLTPEKLLQFVRIGSSDLSPDGSMLVYSTSVPDIEANTSRSSLYAIGWDGKGRKLLISPSSSVSSPSWIAGGKRVAYLSTQSGSNQLWSMASDGSDLQQLTNVDGGIDAYKFSPDGKSILYVKEIKYGKRVRDIYPDLPKASGRLISQLMYRHWDEWVESIPHIFVAHLGQEPITEGKDILEGEPYEAPMKPYVPISDVTWSPDSRSIAYASRKKEGLACALSTNSDIYLYNIESGKTVNLTEGMMGYDTDPVFSPDGRTLAWVSMERDGYEADLRRLFTMDLKTGKKSFVSDGFEYDVQSPLWAPDGKSLYFIACKEAEHQIFQLMLKSNKVRQVTSGQHDYVSLLLRGTHLVAGRQSMELPTDLYRVDSKTGQAEAITSENREILSKIPSISVQKRWVKTTDGGNMLVWIILPPKFDPNKKYPALLYCQGGPQSPVSQFFSYRWNFRLMAEQGYVVVAPNRHGVPGFGKAWNEQISGDYSGQNIQDYLSAIDDVKKEPWVDADRLGAVGASYGGYSIYYLAGYHEGRFKAFVAHAGLFNLEAQYMMTEELWFTNWDMGGAPWERDNVTAQRTFRNSPHHSVDKWDTPILVIHGEKDYRVPADQGMAAFNAAQMRGIPSELLIFPDENHWIVKPQNALLWHRTFFAWLNRWLQPKTE